MRQVIQVWLEDKPGALMRVAGILTAKGINIESVIMTPDPFETVASRMIIVADVEPRLRKRVIQEMNRLVNVFLAVDATEQQRGSQSAIREAEVPC